MIRLLIKRLSIILILLPHFAWSKTPVAESSIKATYLYKISQFTTWPESAFNKDDNTFKIAIISDEPISSVFKKMETKQVRGRNIVVEQFDEGKIPKDLAKFQAVYLHDIKASRLAAINQSIQDLPILTFSDADKLTDSPTLVTFVRQKSKMRFAINSGQADRIGIKFNSQLLRIALTAK